MLKRIGSLGEEFIAFLEIKPDEVNLEELVGVGTGGAVVAVYYDECSNGSCDRWARQRVVRNGCADSRRLSLVVGWGKAVRYALTENPVSDYRPVSIDLPLFKLGEEEAVWARTTASITNGGSQK